MMVPTCKSWMALGGKLSAYHIVTKETDPHCFNRNIKNALIQAVVENLNRRFPVISAFGIFNPDRKGT